MPSATDELRDAFPGGADEAIEVLSAAGYKLTRAWTWIPPRDHDPTKRELDAIEYLFQEWDFGGIDA